IDFGNGFDFWKTIPIRLRRAFTSRCGSWMLAPSKRIVPAVLTPSTRSFILLKQRKSVDLPQPEGPMNAVIFFSGIFIVMSFRACDFPYQSDRLSTVRIGCSIIVRFRRTSGEAGCER